MKLYFKKLPVKWLAYCHRSWEWFQLLKCVWTSSVTALWNQACLDMGQTHLARSTPLGLCTTSTCSFSKHYFTSDMIHQCFWHKVIYGDLLTKHIFCFITNIRPLSNFDPTNIEHNLNMTHWETELHQLNLQVEQKSTENIRDMNTQWEREEIKREGRKFADR